MYVHVCVQACVCVSVSVYVCVHVCVSVYVRTCACVGVCQSLCHKGRVTDTGHADVLKFIGSP